MSLPRNDAMQQSGKKDSKGVQDEQVGNNAVPDLMKYTTDLLEYIERKNKMQKNSKKVDELKLSETEKEKYTNTLNGFYDQISYDFIDIPVLIHGETFDLSTVENTFGKDKTGKYKYPLRQGCEFYALQIQPNRGFDSRIDDFLKTVSEDRENQEKVLQNVKNNQQSKLAVDSKLNSSPQAIEVSPPGGIPVIQPQKQQSNPNELSSDKKNSDASKKEVPEKLSHSNSKAAQVENPSIDMEVEDIVSDLLNDGKKELGEPKKTDHKRVDQKKSDQQKLSSGASSSESKINPLKNLKDQKNIIVRDYTYDELPNVNQVNDFIDFFTKIRPLENFRQCGMDSEGDITLYFNYKYRENENIKNHTLEIINNLLDLPVSKLSSLNPNPAYINNITISIPLEHMQVFKNNFYIWWHNYTEKGRNRLKMLGYKPVIPNAIPNSQPQKQDQVSSHGQAFFKSPDQSQAYPSVDHINTFISSVMGLRPVTRIEDEESGTQLNGGKEFRLVLGKHLDVDNFASLVKSNLIGSDATGVYTIQPTNWNEGAMIIPYRYLNKFKSSLDNFTNAGIQNAKMS